MDQQTPKPPLLVAKHEALPLICAPQTVLPGRADASQIPGSRAEKKPFCGMSREPHLFARYTLFIED
jgi:hypothetical protein